jgi:hypothetical protein
MGIFKTCGEEEIGVRIPSIEAVKDQSRIFVLPKIDYWNF